MSHRIYLLTVEELISGAYLEEMTQRAIEWLDDTRREKAKRLRTQKARAASVGAGLLLQLAAADWEDPGAGTVWAAGQDGQGGGRDNTAFVLEYGVSRLLQELAKRQPGPRSLSYAYGPRGKPYLEGIPMEFSLSHSGEYVLCAVSRREIGADIQKMQPIDMGRLAARFFSGEEWGLLNQCSREAERQDCFYRLWTRKEAYGKLTGDGVAEVLGVNMQPDGDCIWQDVTPPPGYRAAVCTRKADSGFGQSRGSTL